MISTWPARLSLRLPRLADSCARFCALAAMIYSRYVLLRLLFCLLRLVTAVYSLATYSALFGCTVSLWRLPSISFDVLICAACMLVVPQIDWLRFEKSLFFDYVFGVSAWKAKSSGFSDPVARPKFKPKPFSVVLDI